MDATGKCVGHGGGKRCEYPDCSKSGASKCFTFMLLTLQAFGSTDFLCNSITHLPEIVPIAAIGRTDCLCNHHLTL
jgi:hypothetical protein